ncbi:SDR family NAD(P)-dependent oxidoreductase [Xanthobacter sp. VTT E-85241]|uniref:SDR family NAD(P)-dependent oxidoreductase n=1 Tax=Roseixanthobacter finlandensis TaxID=3119922 RepID=UPI0037299322
MTEGMSTLLAVGLGYCGRALLARDGLPFARVIGTSRTREGAQALAALSRPGLAVTGLPFDGVHLSANLEQALRTANVLLLSAPPGEAGDPVLAVGRAALMANAHLRSVIYLTTLGVYGDHKGAWVDERAKPKPGSVRLERRLAAEAEWLRFGGARDVPVAVLRLAGIYGPGRNALVQVARGEARRIDKPDQVFNRIHVDDISASIRNAVKRRFHGVVNVTDDLPTAPSEPILAAATLLGVEPPPAIPFDEAARDMTPMALSFWAANKRVDNGRLKHELGVTLTYPTYRQGLAALYAAGEGRDL